MRGHEPGRGGRLDGRRCRRPGDQVEADRDAGEQAGDVGGVRLQHGLHLRGWGQRGARCYDRFQLGALGFFRRQHAGGSDGLEDEIAGAEGGFGVAIKAARLGCLRQRDEQRGFGDRQALRLLAEVFERGGAHAFDATAEGRKAEVEAEDLFLAELLLELQGADDLPELH